jgi:hypothetical protein
MNKREKLKASIREVLQAASVEKDNESVIKEQMFNHLADGLARVLIDVMESAARTAIKLVIATAIITPLIILLIKSIK